MPVPSVAGQRTAADEIKSYVDRIERVEGERKDLAGDVKDIYTEAKGRGYNPKALRRVIAERRKKTDAQFEAEVEVYRAALAEPGATYRSVAEQTGTSKSKLQRLVPREKNGTTPPHDPETGEINVEDVRVGRIEPASGGGDLPCVEAGSADLRDAIDAGDNGAAANTDVRPAAAASASPEPARTEGAGKSPPEIDTRSFDEIVGEHPDFLRRTKTSAEAA